jgi:hypothetical protein
MEEVRHKVTYCVISFIRNIQNKYLSIDESTDTKQSLVVVRIGEGKWGETD